MTNYDVYVNRMKSAEPERVLQTWFGVNWRGKLDQLNPGTRGNIYSMYKPAAHIKIFRIN